MKLVPLADRVVLKQLEAETKTKTGIILTSSAQEKPQEAEVVAVGPGTEDVKMEDSHLPDPAVASIIYDLKYRHQV